MAILKTLEDVKIDMENDIKYLFSLDLDTVGKLLDDPILKEGLFKRAAIYNNLAMDAPQPLPKMFILIYMFNYTQKQVANELGISQSYVSRLHKKLLLYFVDKINEMEENNSYICDKSIMNNLLSAVYYKDAPGLDPGLEWNK